MVVAAGRARKSGRTAAVVVCAASAITRRANKWPGGVSRLWRRLEIASPRGFKREKAGRAPPLDAISPIWYRFGVDIEIKNLPLTHADAGRILGVSRERVGQLVRMGRIPADENGRILLGHVLQFKAAPKSKPGRGLKASIVHYVYKLFLTFRQA